MELQLQTYFRMEKLPHIWCPGCGNGIITGALVNAIASLGLDQNKVIVVSGIGCSSRASGYLDFNTLHTTHGRALAFATGIKMANPELTVFVLMGDGDATAIGGNHFIHAARRNINLNVLIFNNSIYGMTGGQFSPLTPQGKKATTAPYGTIDRSFDVAELAKGAGATYIARATAYHVKLLTELIASGVLHKGFSVVEAISQCPVAYGRKNKLGDPAQMLTWQKENAVNVKTAAKFGPNELENKFLIGEIYRGWAPEYTEEYDKIISSLK